MDVKKLAAEKAVELVENNMIVGLGTGSTAYWAIQAIGNKVQEGWNLKAVATSLATERLAKERNIPLFPFSEIDEIDIAIDGADEIDPDKNLIKGGGGALLREKIVATNSNRFIVIADESKLVSTLGKFPLPVEVLPFGWELTVRQIRKLCEESYVRLKDNAHYLTDNGNLIVDCHFDRIEDTSQLNAQLKNIAGILETGLFLYSPKYTVIIAHKTGEVKWM